MYNPMGMSDVMIGQQNYLMGYEKQSGRTFMGPDNGLSKTYSQAWQDPQLIAREVGIASYYNSMENAMASQARSQANTIRLMADAQAYATSRPQAYTSAYGGGGGASAYASNPSLAQSYPRLNVYGQMGGQLQPLGNTRGISGLGALSQYLPNQAGFGQQSPYGGFQQGGFNAGGFGYNPQATSGSMNVIFGLLQQILSKLSQQPTQPIPIQQPVPIFIPYPIDGNGGSKNGGSITDNGWGKDTPNIQPKPPANTGTTPVAPSDGIDMNTLLLLMLMGQGGGDILPSLNQIIHPLDPNPDSPGGRGWGDPHFNLPWIKETGHMDFHGDNLDANGGVAAYRAYDNGKSAINMLFQGKDNAPTIMNEVAGKIGKDVEFHYDADTSKLIVNGKELKPGESVRATGTGVTLPNGQEAAGWIMLDNNGRVTVNTGDAEFNWKREGMWQGMNYLNINYKVTEAGTSAVKNKGGKANALGGMFGSSISTGKEAFKEIAKKKQSEIDAILDKALRLKDIKDFSSQKLLEGQAPTQKYKYGNNASASAQATS